MSNPEIPERPRLSVSRALTGALIGALAGFGPAPQIGPGLWITLVVLFLLLRAPLITVLSVGVVAKLLSFVATPLSYELGVFLLDGPTSELFRTAINAPFLALFGLEYYTVTGGLFLGLILGVLATPVILRLRKKTTPGKRPGIIRPLGVLVAVLLIASLWFLQSAAAQSLLTTETANTLSKLNGATVDVAGVELDLADSSLKISDMAFANPRALNTDLFHGVELSANLASSDLLRKRLHIEQLVVRRAESGKPRGVPGVLVGKVTEPEVEPPAEGEKRIEDYLKDWKVWKERLGQAREWLEKMSDDGSGEPVSQDSLPLGSRVATGLIDEAPTLLVSEILVEGFTLDWLAGESLTLGAHNLSTQPSLVSGAMDLSLKTNSDLFQLALVVPTKGDAGRLDFSLRGLKVDKISSMLKLGEGNGLSGGTLDLSLKGPWSGGRAGYIDLPLDIKLHDIQLALSGSKSFPIAELVLPVHLKGPIDRPNVRLDASALTKSLRDAGAKELANFVDAKKAELKAQLDAKKGELIDQGKAQLQEKVGGKIGELLGTEVELDVENLKQTQADLEAAAKAKLEEEARSQAAKKAAELLGDGAKPLVDALEGGDLGDVKETLEDAKKTLEDQAKEAAAEAAKGQGKKALDKLFGGKKPD